MTIVLLRQLHVNLHEFVESSMESVRDPLTNSLSPFWVVPVERLSASISYLLRLDTIDFSFGFDTASSIGRVKTCDHRTAPSEFWWSTSMSGCTCRDVVLEVLVIFAPKTPGLFSKRSLKEENWYKLWLRRSFISGWQNVHPASVARRSPAARHDLRRYCL